MGRDIRSARTSNVLEIVVELGKVRDSENRTRWSD